MGFAARHAGGQSIGAAFPGCRYVMLVDIRPVFGYFRAEKGPK